jgi:hypothetical protein
VSSISATFSYVNGEKKPAAIYLFVKKEKKSASAKILMQESEDCNYDK